MLFRICYVSHVAREGVHLHPQALCETDLVGPGTRIWAFAHLLPGARVGADCNICDHAFIEGGAVVGDRVTIKNACLIWDGVTIEDEVFVGHGVMFTNDVYPRATTAGGAPQTEADWMVVPTVVRRGASIGSNATLLPGIVVGAGAMVGAGAVVTRDVPDHAIAVGVPARVVGDTRGAEHVPPSRIERR